MGIAKHSTDSPQRRTGRWRWVLGLVVAALLTTAAECDLENEPTGEGQIPAVVGLKLDKAKDALSDIGFADPDTYDAVEDRSAFKDSNWVVVAQDPAPGGTVEKKTTLKLGIAKPDDPGFDKLLAAGGGEELLAQRQRDRDKQAAKEQAEEAEQRNPCALFDGIGVDTRLFDSTLQKPKKDVADADVAGYIRVTIACGNEDEGLVVHAITSQTPQDAIREANFAADDREGFFTNNAFAVERFPDEAGGGGYWVNTDMGSSRLTWAVDNWFIMVEAYFWDAVMADVKGISNAGETVVSMFADLREHGTAVIRSGNW